MMASPEMASHPAGNKRFENSRVAQAIDHTKLTFGQDENEQASIEALCREAMQAGFYAVCVRPRHIALAKAVLVGSSVKVATVIGFPLQKAALAQELEQPTVGNVPTAEKVFETVQSLQAGADELDLVINVAGLKQDVQTGSRQVLEELAAIAEAASGCPIKVIIETDLLTPTEMMLVTEWCADTGMGMVKTSTGMVEGGHGATVEAVELIAHTLKSKNAVTGIKASGGIKNRQQAEAFLALGVNRLGTSSGLAILQGDSTAEASGY